MSAVSTGTGPFPTSAQLSGGAFLSKSETADSEARPWIFYGDEKIFYLAVKHAAARGYQTYFFGEPIGFKTPDAYNTVLGAAVSSVVSSGEFGGAIDRLNTSETPSSFSAGDSIVPRAATGLGTARSVGRMTIGGVSVGESGVNSVFAYPNQADNALIFAEILMRSEQTLRARFPGVYWVPQNLNYAFSTLDTVVGAGAFSGKTFAAIRGANNGNGGAYFFDRDGPWR